MARRGHGNKAPIDFEIVKQLSSMFATDEEIAAQFNVSVDTLTRRGKEYQDAKEEGRRQGMLNLRKMQLQAVKEKNPTMLIWLGKQYLGQTDTTRIEHSGSIGRPLAGCSAEELRKALKMYEDGQAKDEQAKDTDKPE